MLQNNKKLKPLQNRFKKQKTTFQVKKTPLRFKKQKLKINSKEDLLMLKNLLKKKQEEKDFPHHWYPLIFKRWKIDPIALLLSFIITYGSERQFWVSYCLLLIIIQLSFEAIRLKKIMKK